jgi:hypothetical protein
MAASAQRQHGRDALQVKIALFDRQRVSRAHCGLQLLIVSEIMRP